MNRPICFAREERLVHEDLEAEQAEKKKSVKTTAVLYDPGPNPLLLVPRTHHMNNTEAPDNNINANISILLLLIIKFCNAYLKEV